MPANVAPGGEESAAERPKPRPRPRPRPDPPAPKAPAAPPPDYADLESEEIIALLGDLDADQLQRLREHEVAGAARESVVAAIDSLLARSGSPA